MSSGSFWLLLLRPKNPCQNSHLYYRNPLSDIGATRSWLTLSTAYVIGQSWYLPNDFSISWHLPVTSWNTKKETLQYKYSPTTWSQLIRNLGFTWLNLKCDVSCITKAASFYFHCHNNRRIYRTSTFYNSDIFIQNFLVSLSFYNLTLQRKDKQSFVA